MRFIQALAAPALFALAACGGGGESKQESGTSSPEAATPAAASAPAVASAESGSAAGGAPAAFTQCLTCHTIKQGVNSIGPSLFGVVGRKAGSIAGFAYSDALKASGKTWDDESLDKWITQPMKEVPGTKMTFPGLADAAKRKEIIEYLKTLK